MRILDYVRKVPSGLMIIPMFITALINTVFPQALQIGGITTELFTTKGTMAMIGVILFITGSQFRVSEIGMTLKRGGLVCLGRLIIGYAAAFVMLRYIGLDGFWGISALAIGAAIVSTNPGIYIGLVEQYGDGVDRAAFGILNVIAVPAAPIVIMEAAAGGAIDYMSIVSTLAPFFLGMLLGNLDEKIRGMMAPGLPIILPFLGFCFGSGINLISAAMAGGAGVLLAIIYLVINVPLMFLLDRVALRRPGYMSVATCSVAGIAVAVPTMLADMNPVYAPYVEAATAQIAMAIIITSFSIPAITVWIVKHFGSGKAAASMGHAQPEAA